MPSLNDPYGVLADAVDVVCEECGHELAYDFDKFEIYCPQCRLNTVERVPYTRCDECGCGLDWYDEWYRYVCPQCGMSKEGDCPYLREEQSVKGAQYDPLKHFWFWITHILGWEPVSELGDAFNLLEKMKDLRNRDKISAPSVDDCRRWLKELGRSKLYKNMTRILKWLTNADHPLIDERAIEKAEVRFCYLLRIREKLNVGGNRCYYPFYIYKIFDEILEGEQRWVLSYIHLQSEKTRKKCDKEWKKIEEELEKEISDGYYSNEAVGMLSPSCPPVT